MIEAHRKPVAKTSKRTLPRKEARNDRIVHGVHNYVAERKFKHLVIRPHGTYIESGVGEKVERVTPHAFNEIRVEAPNGELISIQELLRL